MAEDFKAEIVRDNQSDLLVATSHRGVEAGKSEMLLTYFFLNGLKEQVAKPRTFIINAHCDQISENNKALVVDLPANLKSRLADYHKLGAEITTELKLKGILKAVV